MVWGRINESFQISKHFVLNAQQHMSERLDAAAYKCFSLYRNTFWQLLLELLSVFSFNCLSDDKLQM